MKRLALIWIWRILGSKVFEEATNQLIDCPTRSCTLGGTVYSPHRKGGPECWQRNGTGCYYLEDYGEEECSGSYRNILGCGYREPKREKTECPKEWDKCRFYSSLVIEFEDPQAPACWKRSLDGEWECVVRGRGCPAGFADIERCGDSEEASSSTLAKIERCPSPSDTCQHSELVMFKMSDENAPECWAVDSGVVSCRFKAELGGQCPLGSFDTSHCRIINEDQIRECPSMDAKCVYKNHLYGFGKAPQCWKGTLGGFMCQPRDEGCPSGMLDLTLCPETRPPVDPRCPLTRDKCSINGTKYHVKDGPGCWRRTESSIECAFGNPDCPPGFVNIDTCPLREYPSAPILAIATCPSPSDKCFDGKAKFRANDHSRPACWAKVGSRFLCTDTLPCPRNTIDINTCKIGTCPKYNSTCSAGKKLQDIDAPPCWKDTITGFHCQPKSPLGSCRPDEVDIASCSKKLPRPKCPSALSACEYSEIQLSYSLDEPRAPPCWSPKRSPKTHSRYECDFRPPGKKCPRNFIDITKCPPPSTNHLHCPKSASVCRHHSTSVVLGSSTAPECWLLSEKGYRCWYKHELKNQACPPNSIDLDTCQDFSNFTIAPNHLGIFKFRVDSRAYS